MAAKDDCETGEEIFIADNNLNEHLDKEKAIALLNEFSFYFTYFIEEKFQFFLNVLNEQTVPKKSNSKTVSALATAASAIPWIGKAINSGLKEGEIYFLDKIDKKNAVTLAHLIFYFNRNKEENRRTLIETAVEIFYCFEYQFLKLNCNGGPSRAMLKLAHDAAHRIFTYFLGNKEIDKISKQNLVEGIMEGDSLLKILDSSERTVQAGENTWKTSDIYKKVGLFFEENNTYFRRSKTKTRKYGHRRLFSWERGEEILTAQKWVKDEKPSPQPHYYLDKEDLVDLYGSVAKYIARQDSEENLKLDCEIKHEEAMEDRNSKHEEIKQLLISKVEVFDELSRIYQAIEVTQEMSDNVFTTIQGQQVTDSKRHAQLNEQLSALQAGQHQVLQTSQEIRSEIMDIKMSSQYETSSTSENQLTINAVIQNNVTVNQYTNCSSCNQEEPKTLPEILNEAVATIPRPKKIAEALGEVVEDIQDKLCDMRERTQRSPNAVKLREVVREVSENVQERFNEIKANRSENPPIKQFAEAMSRINDPEAVELRRQKVNQTVHKLVQVFRK